MNLNLTILNQRHKKHQYKLISRTSGFSGSIIKEPIITPEQKLDNNLVDFFVAYSEPDELERPASV